MTGQFSISLLLPLPAFQGRPGDRILIRPGHADPVLLIRRLPHRFDVITQAIADGSAEINHEDGEDAARKWVEQVQRRPSASPHLQLVP
jgi:hypothetical protein